MKKLPIVPVLLTGLVAVIIQVVSTTTGHEYYLTQMIMAAYYSTVVMGLCLVMGYAGQVSLGHAAFFAIGGYTSAALTTTNIDCAHGATLPRALLKLGVLVERQDLFGCDLLVFSPWAAFVVAMVFAFLAALFIGYPALRLKGHYLAMATLGFGLIVYQIVRGTDFLGSADGITAVPQWDILPGLTISGRRAYRVANYYFAWSFALLTLFLLLNIVRSRVGRALRSIHGGELAANAMGVNTSYYKLQAFVISAMLAAACGSFMTHYNGGIGPSEAGAMKSVRYVALVAAGGMANLWGAMIVSSILNFLSLRGCFGSYDHAVFGVILIVIVSVAPDGPLKPLATGMARGFGIVKRLLKRTRSPAGLR